MSFREYLRWLKRLYLLLLLAAILLVACGHRLAGAALTLIATAVMWRFCRCPHCGYHIDPRIPVDELACCSSCGGKLTGSIKRDPSD